MTEEPNADRPDRDGLETDIAADIRALTAISEQIGQVFARTNDLRANDFRALMHVATAEIEGAPLTAGGLGKLMGISSSAVTYLVERMIESGHLRRAADPADRRRVILHYDEHGMDVARGFFTPLGRRTRAAMADLADADLRGAHRVLVAVIQAMREYHDELTGE
ncbi:MarR family winged helix-turn-helix transcriptional regulator [Nocardia niwae]|uniref:MarR family winged helix-turn-helix transcriptional regulator n=1 Tax=Nocardia niwae TaxID=626084 RepID=UPI000B295B83|nr:helix-turn-helix domain-containing protein [Nocardia niwae]